MLIPQRMMPHGGLVTFEAKTGHSGNGTTFADPVTPERACIQEKRRLVKGSASEEVSTASVWLDPEYQPPVGSKVTIWKGTPRERTAELLASTYWEHGPGLPEHVELFLT